MDSVEKSRKVYLAVDLGASSGRVMAGVWKNGKLALVEVHRFETPSVKLRGKWHWDFLYLYSEILTGLRMACKNYGSEVVSLAVDTWGVDYGLLDESGELLSNPVCYRDGRTEGLQEKVGSELGRERIYSETGIQFMFFNTLYQLAAEVQEKRTAFTQAKRLLFLPDLLNYWLSGVQATERSIASTSQMLNPVSGEWSAPILDYLSLDPAFLGSIVEAGSALGTVTPEVGEGIGNDKLKVVVAAGHDTGSAFMALPETRPDFAILSSGTWSIMGLEMSEANCSSAALESGFSNEIGFGGSVRFLKNICGLWLLEECRRDWAQEGKDYSYQEIVAFAETAKPMYALIDPDAAVFSKPGGMPKRIQEFCRKHGEKVPESPQEIVRCIFDSLALKYSVVFDRLSKVTGQKLKGLYVLGGGSRNELLNQLSADALGVPVVCGAAESTAFGNLMAQLIADGEASDLASARKLIAPSIHTTQYVPDPESPIREGKARFEALIETKV